MRHTLITLLCLLFCTSAQGQQVTYRTGQVFNSGSICCSSGTCGMRSRILQLRADAAAKGATSVREIKYCSNGRCWYEASYTYPEKPAATIIQSTVISKSKLSTTPAVEVGFSKKEDIDVLLSMLALMPTDRFADLGCGDGRILIAAVRDYGVRTAVGIEIDKDIAATARRNVLKAERDGVIREGCITIITGDVRDFDPKEWKVNKASAYLFDDVLDEVTFLQEIDKLAVPYHTLRGYRATDKEGNISLYDFTRSTTVVHQVVPVVPKATPSRIRFLN